MSQPNTVLAKCRSAKCLSTNWKGQSSQSKIVSAKSLLTKLQVMTVNQRLSVNQMTRSWVNQTPCRLNVSQPNVGWPNVGRPNVSWPNFGWPNVGQPNVGQPNVSQPNVSCSNVGRPNVGWPNVFRPKDMEHFLSCTDFFPIMVLFSQPFKYLRSLPHFLVCLWTYERAR